VRLTAVNAHPRASACACARDSTLSSATMGLLAPKATLDEKEQP
jgi:hypothetical protein